MRERIRESVLDIVFKKAGKSRFNVTEMTHRRELDDLIAKMQTCGYNVIVNMETDGSGYVKNLSVEGRMMDPLSFAEWARAEYGRISNRASFPETYQKSNSRSLAEATFDRQSNTIKIDGMTVAFWNFYDSIWMDMRTRENQQLFPRAGDLINSNSKLDGDALAALLSREIG